MRYLIIIGLSICCHLAVGQNDYSQLELVSITQLKSFDERRFDLSGIVQVEDKYYIVADKNWNDFIYELKFYKDKWFAIEEKPFDLKGEALGQEALDYSNPLFYVANEDNGKIYTMASGQDPQELKIKFADANEDPSSWANAGWEGLAIDEERKTLYLVKEREPRYILTVNLATLNIVDKFDIPRSESSDFADAKFDNGYLYLLERNGNYITKINPQTHEVITKFSYKHICSSPPPNGKLYEPAKFGMAEALLMTPTEIWIGLDNNGKAVSPYARETYQLDGTQPVIIKFKRPSGF